MGQFDVQIPALHRGRTAVDEAHRDVTEEVAKVDRSVRSMLDGSWTGPAAKDYAAGWTEWKEGAQEVLDALDLMGQAMDATLRDYVERDTLHEEVFRRTGSQLPTAGTPLNID